VGKIDKDVTISDEDLKLMREVAERQAIQNFVTLTPTIAMGDMNFNESSDGDLLIQKLIALMTGQVVSTAQEVY